MHTHTMKINNQTNSLMNYKKVKQIAKWKKTFQPFGFVKTWHINVKEV